VQLNALVELSGFGNQGSIHSKKREARFEDGQLVSSINALEFSESTHPFSHVGNLVIFIIDKLLELILNLTRFNLVSGLEFPVLQDLKILYSDTHSDDQLSLGNDHQNAITYQHDDLVIFRILFQNVIHQRKTMKTQQLSLYFLILRELHVKVLSIKFGE